MILSSLRDLARREGLLTNPDYEPRPVAWIIVVGDDGKFVNVMPTTGEDTPGKKPRAKVFQIPRRAGRTSAAAPDFLVDKSEYVLGAEPDGKRSVDDLQVRLELFRQSVQAALDATKAPALAAVTAFIGSEEERKRAVDRVSAEGYKSNDLFAFEHHGQFVHEVPEVQSYFTRTRHDTTEAGVQCLICGTRSAPAEKHPAVKIPGGTTSGISLVSFNSDAFESYGLSRNENAPVCVGCADAYTTGLNRLLSDRYPDPHVTGGTLPRRFVRLSPDTTAVFWADEDAPVLDLFTSYFETPRAESVGAVYESPHKGRPASASGRFYSLILSGGQGRAVLRGMHTGTVAQVEENLHKYFESINIGSEQPQPLSLLMRSIVLQGELKHLTPGMMTDVYLAIVFGRKFPRVLLAKAIGRCQAEQKVTRERAALVRAYLIRNLEVEVTVGLDKKKLSAGYRLGRLMAVLERVQGAAQNNPNKTIVDRYYGAASTRPATIFPRLIALAQHHLAKLTTGLRVFYGSRLGEVMDGLSVFPATLNLEEQGLFALGYYHQKQDFFKKRENGAAETDGESTEGEAA